MIAKRRGISGPLSVEEAAHVSALVEGWKKAYLSGTTLRELESSSGYAYTTIRSRLLAAGVTLRSQGTKGRPGWKSRA